MPLQLVKQRKFRLLPGISIKRQRGAWQVRVRVGATSIVDKIVAKDALDAAQTAIQIARDCRDGRGLPTLAGQAAQRASMEALPGHDQGRDPTLVPHPWDEALSVYMTMIQEAREQNSPDWRQTVFSQITRFCQHAAIKTLDQIQPHHLESWVNLERAGDPAKGKRASGAWSLRQKLANLSKFFRFATRRGWMAWKPNEDLVPRKPPITLPTFCLRSQVDKILVLARRRSRDLALACAIAAYAGLRRSEINRLDWASINLADRRIEIPCSKTGRPRWAPIFDALVPFFPKQKPSGRLFPRWIHEDTLGNQAEAVIRKALGPGINRLGLQILRRTCSTSLQANGVAPSIASDWLGHRVSTAERHYRGRLPAGEKPLEMRLNGRPLERHGLPDDRGPGEHHIQATEGGSGR